VKSWQSDTFGMKRSVFNGMLIVKREYMAGCADT
jgi:hypothetical protein